MLVFHILSTLDIIKLLNISQIDRQKNGNLFNLNVIKMTDVSFIYLLVFCFCVIWTYFLTGNAITVYCWR